MIVVSEYPNENVLGNCGEELPKKPVGQQLADCRPFVGQQVLPEI